MSKRHRRAFLFSDHSQSEYKIMSETNPTPNPAEGFQKLLDKHDKDAMRLASQLYDENFQLREKNRELKTHLPKDGDVVIPAAEAAEFTDFKKLDKKAADIAKELSKVSDLETQNRELSAMETLREVADIGIDGSKLKLSVLKDQIARYPEAVITIKTEKDKDGNSVRNAFIKSKNDSAEVAFSQFAGEELADYLPSLKVSAEASPTQQNPGNGKSPDPQGGPSSFFDRIRESAKSEAAPKVRSIDEAFGRAA